MNFLLEWLISGDELLVLGSVNHLGVLGWPSTFLPDWGEVLKNTERLSHERIEEMIKEAEALATDDMMIFFLWVPPTENTKGYFGIEIQMY